MTESVTRRRHIRTCIRSQENPVEAIPENGKNSTRSIFELYFPPSGDRVEQVFQQLNPAREDSEHPTGGKDSKMLARELGLSASTVEEDLRKLKRWGKLVVWAVKGEKVYWRRIRE